MVNKTKNSDLQNLAGLTPPLRGVRLISGIVQYIKGIIFTDKYNM